MKNKKRVSEYDSENITYNLISEIIQKNNYDNLDIAVHIPLKHILKELDKTRTKFCNLLTEKNGYAGADELKKDAMKLFDRLDEYATKLDDSYEKL